MPRTQKQDKAYKNPDNDPRGPWKTSDLSARNFYALGKYSIRTPSGREIDGPPGGNYWRYSEEKFWKINDDNRIWWGRKGDAIPQIKRFLSEVKQGITPQTIWSYEEVGHTQEAKKEILSHFGTDVFLTPKPERLMRRILQIATNSGDLVLDSFLGSGTTAAVAHKMGRHWIGVELGEHAVSHCAPRLNKVIDGEQGGISKASAGRAAADSASTSSVRRRSRRTGGSGPISGFRSSPLIYGSRKLAGRGTARGRDAPVPRCSASTTDAPGRCSTNGVLGDRRRNGGNVLTRTTLATIRAATAAAFPGFDGPLTVYGEQSRLTPATLQRERIAFKQTPYDVKARE